MKETTPSRTIHQKPQTGRSNIIIIILSSTLLTDRNLGKLYKIYFYRRFRDSFSRLGINPSSTVSHKIAISSHNEAFVASHCSHGQLNPRPNCLLYEFGAFVVRVFSTTGKSCRRVGEIDFKVGRGEGIKKRKSVGIKKAICPTGNWLEARDWSVTRRRRNNRDATTTLFYSEDFPRMNK